MKEIFCRRFPVRSKLQYVLCKGSHGLANRILVLSTAIRLCRITGAKLIIDWNDGLYGPITFWEAFQLVSCEEILAPNQDPRELNGLQSTQYAWEGRFEVSADSIYQDISGCGEYAGVDLQEIYPISGLKSFFFGQDQKDVLVLAGYQKRGQKPIELLRHFRLSTLWEERLLEDLRLQEDDVINSNYVGIHIRAAAGNSFPSVNSDRIIDYMHHSKNQRAYLSTDVLNVIEPFRIALGNQLVTIPKTYVTEPNLGNSSELYSLHRHPHHSILPKGLILFEAIRDVWYLSRSHSIFAHPCSTFSELACLFSLCPPWRIHFTSKVGAKYHLGAIYRGSLKYRYNGAAFGITSN